MGDDAGRLGLDRDSRKTTYLIEGPASQYNADPAKQEINMNALHEALAQCLEVQAEAEPGEDVELLRRIDEHIEQLTERLLAMGECRWEMLALLRRVMAG